MEGFSLANGARLPCGFSSAIVPQLKEIILFLRPNLFSDKWNPIPASPCEIMLRNLIVQAPAKIFLYAYAPLLHSSLFTHVVNTPVLFEQIFNN